MPPSCPAELIEAAQGLLFPSESEFPFEPFGWAQDEVGASPTKKISQLSGQPESSVCVVEVADLFGNIACPHEWHDEVQAAAVPRFRRLEQQLHEHLQDVRAYRVGVVEVDIYLVGRTAGGDWAGVKTRAIET